MTDILYLHCTACYGAGSESVVGESVGWVCQRCLARATRSDCCLCLLRGGALKPTDGGQWAHLTCAMAIPEVNFGDASQKQPIMTEGITRSTRKMVRHYIIGWLIFTSSMYTVYCQRFSCTSTLVVISVVVNVQRCSLCSSVSSEVAARGHGVCVECAKPNCHTAMHVTCAQYNGLPSCQLSPNYLGFFCNIHATVKPALSLSLSLSLSLLK